MKNLWIKILAFVQRWPGACKQLNAAMVSPLIAYRDAKQVSGQCEDLAKSSRFNAVAPVVDMQSGRGRSGPNFAKPGYILRARTPTALTKEGERNLRLILKAGVTPSLITFNDWVLKNEWPDMVPSIGGPVDAATFYGDKRLQNEMKFLESLEPYYPYIHIQLSLESQKPEAIPFDLALARHLRAKGFKGKIIVNPLDESNEVYKALKAQFDEMGVVRAQSHHKKTPPPDPIWNTDGYGDPNQFNAGEWIQRFRDSGKEYIFHSQELKNCPGGIPKGYL